MKKYFHHYRCGCVNWCRNEWVTEESDSADPKYDSKHHYELDRKYVHLSAKGVDQGFTHCQRYLKFAHTQKISQPNKSNLPVNDIEVGKRLLLDYAKTGSNKSTIAVMWDPWTSGWYRGHCNHLLSADQTDVRSDISLYIESLKFDPKDWAFGWNCAEVHCITKAFKKRKEIDAQNMDLTNCYFIAYSVSKGGFYGGCKTCQNWIPQFGGKSYSPTNKIIIETKLEDKEDKDKGKGKGSNNNNARPKEAPLRIDLE